MNWKKVKVGDVITFTTETFHSGKVRAKRIVTHVERGFVGVTLFGYRPYELTGPYKRTDKLLKIERNGTTL